MLRRHSIRGEQRRQPAPRGQRGCAARIAPGHRPGRVIATRHVGRVAASASKRRPASGAYQSRQANVAQPFMRSAQAVAPCARQRERCVGDVRRRHAPAPGARARARWRSHRSPCRDRRPPSLPDAEPAPAPARLTARFRGVARAPPASLRDSDQNSWCPRMYATGSPCRRRLSSCWNDQPAAAGSSRSGAARRSVRDRPVTYSSSSSASRRARTRTSARAAASRYAARRRSSESRTIAHRHFIVGRNRIPATHHARLSERYRTDRRDADGAPQRLDTGPCELFLKLEAESRRLDQGPHRPVDDRGRRAARRASSPATRWSKAPPATPASAWRWSRSRRATG